MNEPEIYMELQRNIQTAIGHMRLGHFDSATFNLKMASENLSTLDEIHKNGRADEVRGRKSKASV